MLAMMACHISTAQQPLLPWWGNRLQPRMKLLEDQLRSWQGIAGVVSLLTLFFSAEVVCFRSGGDVDEENKLGQTEPYIMIFILSWHFHSISTGFARFMSLWISTCIHRFQPHGQEWRTASWESSEMFLEQLNPFRTLRTLSYPLVFQMPCP